MVALVGDLAFLHDLTALVRLQGDDRGVGGIRGITVVVVDNGGGGIFSFLPQRSGLSNRPRSRGVGVPDEAFENLFGTPPATGVGAVARGLGATVTDVSTISRPQRGAP